MLQGRLKRPKLQKDLEYNYSYYPVVFKSESELLRVFEALNKEEIYPRRYFFPSLNLLPYHKDYQCCPISENISLRIACLPLYPSLATEDAEKIANIIIKNLD